ncbi:uncharacterized protein LOC134325307 [Trichomycterus rosablanca]|uniref:uncharacterized protein LOC134325307 n=1 Tax=Trichomycterus rosablanca TaxID=2290929 RepID=UPI002F358B7A
MWKGPDNKPCLPSYYFPYFAKMAHGVDHCSRGGMVDAVKQQWFVKGFSNYSQTFSKKCLTCLKVNSAGAVQKTHTHPEPDMPFDHLQMDFIELTPCQKKKYVLVIVDMFSKWVEAYPTTHQDTLTVAKILMREIIPRFGIPRKISSDNGPSFVGKILTHISDVIGMPLHKHCAYHPQSAGLVERTNGTIKQKLIKVCQETGLNWVEALPLVCMSLRQRVSSRTKLSPFEIMFGRPPNTGCAPKRDTLALEDDHMQRYCATLCSVLSDVHRRVKESLPSPAVTGHTVQPGDWILTKIYKRANWKADRWQGPFQVLLVTHTAVKIAERDTWIHISHCKKAPTPE